MLVGQVKQRTQCSRKQILGVPCCVVANFVSFFAHRYMCRAVGSRSALKLMIVKCQNSFAIWSDLIKGNEKPPCPCRKKGRKTSKRGKNSQLLVFALAIALCPVHVTPLKVSPCLKPGPSRHSPWGGSRTIPFVGSPVTCGSAGPSPCP